ncbi:hypothetical protein BDR06DRAFT_951748 [Suillus hirtellus]|nr:hypothetical protein BDR06DRAFT_951748 [Suillus hirtellus]
MLECTFTRRLTSLSSSIPISYHGTAHHELFSVLLPVLLFLITFRTALPYAWSVGRLVSKRLAF